MPFEPTREQVDRATDAIVKVLRDLGLSCCLVGGVACTAYGMTRTPHDVDMIVMGWEYDEEDLKQRVTAMNPAFYTLPSQDPSATYRVLFYRFPDTGGISYSTTHKCKVDLLLPKDATAMRIPTVPVDRMWQNTSHNPPFPLMPPLPTLLLKLQAWQDHRESDKIHFHDKLPQDVTDIREMSSSIVSKWGDKLHLSKDEQWLPASFVAAAKARVAVFVALYPDTRANWFRLGFAL